MKRGESPTDQEADRQGEEASGGAQPLAKRHKTTAADEESEDEAEATATEQGVARLKSVPEDQEDEEEEEDTAKMAAASPADAAGGKPAASASLELLTQSFPQRLMEMLDSGKVPDAMWWAEEGKAFAMDLSKFEDVLHRHFQATKYASFTRKLNKWGFRKINNIDPEAPESVVLYRHDLFQQNRPDLLTSMSTKRKKKDKKGKEASSKKQKDDSNRSGDEDITDTTTTDVQAEEEQKQDTMTGATRQEEEKAYSLDEPQQPSLRQHLRPMQESEAKSDGASAESTPDVMRQQLQQRLSLASSLATHRMTGQQPATIGVQDMPAGLSVANLQQEQRNRQFLQSLIVQESEQQQHQRLLEIALLRQQQQQQGSLASEMVAQRHLAAASSTATNRLPLAIAPSTTLGGRLSSLQDPAHQGFHQLTSGAGSWSVPPARSHSMTDMQHVSELATRLGLQQQAQAQGNMQLGLQGQSYSELRAALDARTLQRMPSSPAESRLALPNIPLDSFGLLSPGNRSAAAHPPIHHSRSFPDASSLLQLQLERHVELSRLSSSMSASAAGGAASLAGAGAAASFPAVRGGASSASNPNDQQLLELLLERQRLEQQLQEELRRRQQGR